jgi:hypothetical protein
VHAVERGVVEVVEGEADAPEEGARRCEEAGVISFDDSWSPSTHSSSRRANVASPSARGFFRQLRWASPSAGGGGAGASTKRTLSTGYGAWAGQECEIPNFKGSSLGHFPLVSADFWTSDHLSERSRSVDAFSRTRARGTRTLKRR